MANSKKLKQMKHKRKVQRGKSLARTKEFEKEEAEEKYIDLLNTYRYFFNELTPESIAFGAEICQWYVLEARISGEKTQPKTRLLLGDNVGETVLLYGNVGEVRETDNYRQLLIIDPYIYNTPHLKYKETLTISELKDTINNYNDKPKRVDSHIWVDLDNLVYTGNDKGAITPEGSYIFILGKVKAYKGVVTDKARKKSIKYTIDKGNVVATGYPALEPSKRENLSDIKTIVNLEKNRIGDHYRLKWDKQEQKYLVGEAFDHSIETIKDNIKRYRITLNDYSLNQLASALASYLPQYKDLVRSVLKHRIVNYEETIEQEEIMFPTPKKLALIVNKKKKQNLNSFIK